MLLVALALHLAVSFQRTGAADVREIPNGFGVNAHYNRETRDFEAGQTEEMAAVGFRMVRSGIPWIEVERHPGVLDFKRLDDLVRKSVAAGLRPVLILDPNNLPLTGGESPRTPESVAAFARFCGAAAARYREHRPIWEIANEPWNKKFWKPAPNADDYARLVIAAAQAIRQAAPEAVIAAGSVIPQETAFLKRMLDDGVLGYIDEVSVHPYRWANPESALDNYKYIRELIAGYHPSRRVGILDTEWGYPSTYPGQNEERKADYTLRLLLVDMMAGVDGTLIYEWNDVPGSSAWAQHAFGLRDEAQSPRLSYLALKGFANQMKGYRLEQFRNGGPKGDFILVFRKGDQTRFVGWTASGDPSTAEDAHSNPTGNAGASSIVDFHGKRLQLRPRPQVWEGRS